MTDRFKDLRTFRKHSEDKSADEKRILYKRADRIYAKYAFTVGVVTVDDTFKESVDAFRQFFNVPSSIAPSGLFKQQWIAYYKDHH